MEAHHGAEARELCPTVVERAPAGIAYATITADEECSCVTVPIGQTRNAEVAGCGNLGCQGLPTRGDVGTPNKGSRALHTGKSGAGEDAHAFVRQAVFCAVVVVDTFHMTEREGIAQGAEGATAEACHIVVVGRLVAEVIGFGRVEPDGVDTLAHQSFIKVIPIAGSRVGVIDIIGACSHAGGITLNGDEAASLAKLLVLLGVRTEVWPYADHQFGIHGMHLVYHALIVAVFRVEKLHGVPVVVVAPVLPVLHHAVEGHAKLAVFSHHVDDFLGALIALLALV